MTRIGRRDTLIAFEAKTVTNNDHNEEIETWAEAFREWARVIWGGGSERRQAAVEQGQQTATFVVPDNARTRALTIANRITRGGEAWDITGIADGIPGELEFTAVAAR